MDIHQRLDSIQKAIELHKIPAVIKDFKVCFAYLKEKQIGNGLVDAYEEEFILLTSGYNAAETRTTLQTASHSELNIDKNQKTKGYLKLLGQVRDLVDDANLEPTPKVPFSTEEQKKEEILITLPGNPNDFTPEQQQKFLAAIAKLLEIPNTDIKITKIEKGSVKITIEIPSDKAKTLIKLIIKGALKEWDLQSVQRLIEYSFRARGYSSIRDQKMISLIAKSDISMEFRRVELKPQKQVILWANLQGMNLQGANLREANLRKANLRKANLRERVTIMRSHPDMLESMQSFEWRDDYIAKLYLFGMQNLEGADLQGVNLEGVNLQGADLREANLEGVNLQGADLREANLEGVNLQGADLREANLEGANLQGMNLQGMNLQGAKLQGAKLLWADLREADLRGTDLHWAYLGEADLREADLQEADLQRATLHWAGLRGAKLQGANLQGANLLGANLQGADLQGADLQGTYLRFANLQGADLQEAELQGADLLEADLQEANLIHSKIDFAQLHKSYYQGAIFHLNDQMNLVQAGIDISQIHFVDDGGQTVKAKEPSKY